MKPYNRILIANRGEIAIRILRTCRALGIETVALYTTTDQNSLHVRLADQAVPLPNLESYSNPDAILEIAQLTGADAVHPGYGFLAEREDFIRACVLAGIDFIGPSAGLVAALTDKIAVLIQAEAAGFPVIRHSRICFDEHNFPALADAAEQLGYPIVVKSCRGGRGRGERIVMRSEQLQQAVFRAQAESQVVYGQRSVYLEKALLPAHQVNVQILGDSTGKRIHLGEREGSILLGNQKVIEESPAPCLNPEQRRELLQMSLALADLFNLHNAAAVEYLIDSHGQIYFTEVKTRIQVEHPLSENLSRLDLIAEQIRLAAGEPLGLTQGEVNLAGWAMQCRLTAQDPWGNFLPSLGRLRSVRFPSGADVRVDSFVQSGYELSSEYDPLLAKISCWAPSREVCLRRMKHALAEVQITGVPTNLPLLQGLMSDHRVIGGNYNTDISTDPVFNIAGQLKELDPHSADEILFRDLAIAVAVSYAMRGQAVSPVIPDRIKTGWHRNSRRLPG